MKNTIKKQIWLSENDYGSLKEVARKCCLTETGYIRMLLKGYVPKEKPDASFYETMNQVSQFSEQIQNFTSLLRECGSMDADILQDEVHRWHQFQLAIEERFLAPEKVPWL